MQKTTHMIQDFLVSFVKKKKQFIFKKIGYSFQKVLENVTINVFPYFLIPILNYIVCLCSCVVSHHM